MFEKFGEFDSAEEINQAAEGLLIEGDTENLVKLATENGLDEEFAKAYASGEIPFLTDALMAAVGKIEIEKQALKESILTGIKEDLVNYLLTSCNNQEFAKAIRKRGKSLQKCMDTCAKQIEELARQQKKQMVCLSVRNNDVYAMMKNYYFTTEAPEDVKKIMEIKEEDIEEAEDVEEEAEDIEEDE